MKRAGALNSRDKGLSRLPKKRKAKKLTKPVATTTALVRQEPLSLAENIEKVLIGGDLSTLNVDQRLEYYRKVCQSLGLNHLTKPFAYISFKENEGGPAKLVLYATKDCTEQLRKMYGIGVTKLQREMGEDIVIVEATVQDKCGKPDVGTGVVSLWKYKDGKRFKLQDRELANAIMKAETKAKRRATLSCAGLGFLDESELESVDYNEISPEGRVIQEAGERGTYQAAQDVATRKLAEHAAKQLPVGATTESASTGSGTVLTDRTSDAPAPPHHRTTSTQSVPRSSQGTQTPFKPDVLIQFSEDGKLMRMKGPGCARLGNILKAAGTLTANGFWIVPSADSAEILKAMDELKIKYEERVIMLSDYPAEAEAAPVQPKPPPVATTAPPAQPTAARPPQAKPAAPRPAQPAQAKRGDYAAPPAKIPDHVPVNLVTGKLEKLYTKRPDGVTDLATTGGSRFIRIIVNGTPYTIFANHKMSLNGRDEKRLFEIIEELPIGSHVRFTAHQDAKQYWNVGQVYQLGNLEWDDVTGLSVLRRGDIPGQAKLL